MADLLDMIDVVEEVEESLEGGEADDLGKGMVLVLVLLDMPKSSSPSSMSDVVGLEPSDPSELERDRASLSRLGEGGELGGVRELISREGVGDDR